MLFHVGVAAFAASGVLAAHLSRMDPCGGLVLSFAASVSGGTLRDLILDRHPLYWTHDWVLPAVIGSSPSGPWRICTGGSCPTGRC
ncbi:trimeric intracellular cation channel family protein [Streptomyces sp. NPDC059909]|uniref:trimeric intracellular cation channel family protein n=1 Tax=Streptomyces sp. NPDC059909 TaxID=3346998 RepID=UPI003652B590